MVTKATNQWYFHKARFTPAAMLLYVGDAENKFVHLDAKSLSQLDVTVAAAAKMPDVVVFDSRRNWLVLIVSVPNPWRPTEPLQIPVRRQ